MFSPLDLFNSLSTATPSALTGLAFLWVVFKWGMVLMLLIYDLFAAVIIKQVGIMSETLEDPANGIVRVFAWAHLLASLLLTLAVILFV